MTHAKDDASFLHFTRHLNAILSTSCHWFLAQNMKAFRCERFNNLAVERILNCNHHSIGEMLPSLLSVKLGSGEKLIVCLENTRWMELMGLRKGVSSLWTRFSYRHDFAL